jgi:hypothetical protein
MVKKTFFYLVYLVLIVGLGLAIGLSLHPLHHKKSTTMPAGQAITKSSPKVATKPATPKSSTPATPKTSTNSSATATTTTPSTSTNTTSTSQSQLTNTGPGDIVGLFAVSFAVGTLGFARQQRKRFRVTD